MHATGISHGSRARKHWLWRLDGSHEVRIVDFGTSSFRGSDDLDSEWEKASKRRLGDVEYILDKEERKAVQQRST